MAIFIDLDMKRKDFFQYFIDCLELIYDKHKDFVVIAHNINYISDEGEINFNKENILTLEQDFENKDGNRKSVN